MIRIVGVFVLSVAVILPGFLLSQNLSKRKKYLDELCLLIINIKNSIVDGGDSITDILKRESFGKFVIFKDINFKSIQSKNVVPKLLLENGITRGDTEIITEFFKNLGVSDAESQKSYCDFYYSKFCLLAEDAKRELYDKGKLLKSLFLSLGAVIFIILI